MVTFGGRVHGTARATADEEKDQDTVDLLTGVAEALEKHGWFLRATLGE